MHVQASQAPAAPRVSLPRIAGEVTAAAVCIGFAGIIAQIVLLRELVVVFCGNEMSLGLMLATWLLWTAFGGGVLGRLQMRPRGLAAFLQVAAGVSLPATIMLVRSARIGFRVTPGELLGPGAMLLTSVIALAAFCTLSGWLFAAASRLYANECGASPATATGRVYLLEAVGSCAGGLFASLALFLHASAFQIALLVLLVNAGCAVWLIVRRSPRRLVIGGALAAVIAASLAWIVPSLERASQAMMWRGLRPVASVDSPYGRLDVVDTESTRSVYENGLVAFHAEDVASAEEAVHFALLQHPAPKSLLLIGGGMNGSLGRALQHPTLARSDYVELDPTVLSLAERYLPEQFAALRSARVRSHQLDGRLFVKTTGARFDVIIVNLPEPQTAQLNRFYTREFFAEAAEKLNAGGLLALQLRGAENYISPDLGDFLRCIHATLRSVFADTVVIPGETIHLFAANRTGVLTADPQTLLARLRERGIQTQYVREYYLPFRMAPDRMRELESELHSSGAVAINRDLSPAAYYFGVMLWSTSFDARYRQLFAWLAGVKFANVLLVTVVPLAVLAVAMRLRRRRKGIAGLCVGATGLAMMALEVLLLLGFQAIYGYVYHQLAIVIAAFMAGMALGSWLLLRDARSAPSEPVNAWALPALQLAAAISPLLLYAVLRWLTMMSSGGGLLWASQLLFPAMALAFGILGGYQFQVASRVYFAPADGRRPNPAALYAIDLLGAFAGAIVVSAYLVPVFGILKCTCVIAAVALAPALVALPASTTVRRPAPR